MHVVAPGASRLGVVLLILALAASHAGAATTRWQPGNLQPLIVGWQQFFRVEWNGTKLRGQSAVEGHITNVWGFAATDIQLLVKGFDRSGKMTGQLVAWGPKEIDPGSRVYFDVPVPRAASYEVAIFAWNWVQTGGGDRRRR